MLVIVCGMDTVGTLAASVETGQPCKILEKPVNRLVGSMMLGGMLVGIMLLWGMLFRSMLLGNMLLGRTMLGGTLLWIMSPGSMLLEGTSVARLGRAVGIIPVRTPDRSDDRLSAGFETWVMAESTDARLLAVVGI